MKKFKSAKEILVERLQALKKYRAEWSDEVTKGWNRTSEGGRDILFELYEISGTIMSALENRVADKSCDIKLMLMARRRLEKLVKSDEFDKFSLYAEMCKHGTYVSAISPYEIDNAHVVTDKTKHHIRVMFDCLDLLTA